jgi:lipopolysaccharide export system permease protein
MPRIIPSIAAFHLARIDNDLGNLAENYEFAAMKSAGISLQRAMRSLIAFILLLSVIAFFLPIM